MTNMLFIVLFHFLLTFHPSSSDVSTPHQCLSSTPIDKCYTVIAEQTLNWVDAEKYCEQNLPNGRLASIHNAFQGSLLNSWLPLLTTDPWIGAFQFGTVPFQWTDNSPLDYSYWTPGEPTNSFAQICRTSSNNSGVICVQGKWRTSNIQNASAQFICEYSVDVTTPAPTTAPITGDDCYDIHERYSGAPSGVYLLTPPGSAFEAYCDMDTDGGGWTVFQRRLDNATSFHDKSWNAYQDGFNNGLSNNLWLGNYHIHVLTTKDSNVELRIDLWGDRAPNSSEPNDMLKIDNEAGNYAFHINTSSGSGNATAYRNAGMFRSNGEAFSTQNHFPPDDGCQGCCPKDFGAWWFNSGCSSSALNGVYYLEGFNQDEEVFKWSFGGRYIYPVQCRMMLRKIEDEA